MSFDTFFYNIFSICGTFRRSKVCLADIVSSNNNKVSNNNNKVSNNNNKVSNIKVSNNNKVSNNKMSNNNKVSNNVNKEQSVTNKEVLDHISFNYL